MRLIAFPQWDKFASLLRNMARQSAADYAQRNIVRIIPKNGVAHFVNNAVSLLVRRPFVPHYGRSPLMELKRWSNTKKHKGAVLQTIDEAKTHHRCGGRTACVGTHAAKMAAFPVSCGRDGARLSRCGGLWRLGGTPRPLPPRFAFFVPWPVPRNARI